MFPMQNLASKELILTVFNSARRWIQGIPQRDIITSQCPTVIAIMVVKWGHMIWNRNCCTEPEKHWQSSLHIDIPLREIYNVIVTSTSPSTNKSTDVFCWIIGEYMKYPIFLKYVSSVDIIHKIASWLRYASADIHHRESGVFKQRICFMNFNVLPSSDVL